MPKEIARLPPSPARRVTGAAMLSGIGLALVWGVLTRPASGAGLTVALLAVAVLALAGAVRFWRATAVTLVLTDETLAEDGGRLLARLPEVRAVRRGALAMKPAGGFVLEMSTPAPLSWAPGLWWRTRHRLGVGGATPRLATLAMAEAIAVMVERPTGR
jgi:hypothetical protein